MNSEYAAGLAFGILAALVIFLVIKKVLRITVKGTFDERQELVKGRAYKYAFFTALCMLTLDLVAESFGIFEKLPVTRTLVLFIIILASVMVYALYAIRNDAYLGMGSNFRTYRAVMWIVIICNGISCVTGFREGAMVDGKLAFGPSASLLFCIAFIIILAAIYMRDRSAGSEEASEDEL